MFMLHSKLIAALCRNLSKWIFPNMTVYNKNKEFTIKTTWKTILGDINCCDIGHLALRLNIHFYFTSYLSPKRNSKLVKCVRIYMLSLKDKEGQKNWDHACEWCHFFSVVKANCCKFLKLYLRIQLYSHNVLLYLRSW